MTSILDGYEIFMYEHTHLRFESSASATPKSTMMIIWDEMIQNGLNCP